MRKLIIVLCFLLTALSGVSAGPLRPADIDAKAVWYGHVDMEAVMEQPLIKKAIEKITARKHKNNLLHQVYQKIGLRVMQECCSATMYATQYEGEFGVVLMKFKNDMPKDGMHALFVRKFPKHKEVEFGGRKLYTWSMRCGRKRMRLSGCFVDNRQILVGINLRHVKNALRVLDGKRKAMASDNPLLKGLTPGTLFASRAIDVPAGYQYATYCPVLRHCSEAFVRWTSLGDTIRGRYEFQTASKEKAELYMRAIEGMKAMFTLRFGELDKVMPLLEDFSNVQVGRSVILTWDGNPDQLKAAYNQIRQQRKIRRKIRKEHNKK